MQFACGLHMFALVSHFHSCFHLAHVEPVHKATKQHVAWYLKMWQNERFESCIFFFNFSFSSEECRTNGRTWSKKGHRISWQLVGLLEYELQHHENDKLDRLDRSLLIFHVVVKVVLFCDLRVNWSHIQKGLFHIFSQHSRGGRSCRSVCVLILVLCCFIGGLSRCFDLLLHLVLWCLSSELLFLGRCIRPSTLTKIDVMPWWQTPLRCS